MSKKKVAVDLSGDKEFEDRQKGEPVYEDGKITKYSYCITVKGELPFKGELSREEMEKLYRLYSSEGTNLTQKSVSREFPQFTSNDIRRLFKAFDIKKASSPFAPHQFEEVSADKLIELNLKAKETDYIKKFEEEQSRAYQKLYKDKVLELQEFKNKMSSFEGILTYTPETTVDLSSKPVPSLGKTIIIYLSDIHVGAHNEANGLYDNPFNNEVLKERFKRIVAKINADKYENIIILNLGDSLDSYQKETTRRGHILPSVTTDKENSKAFLDIMYSFFKEVQSTNDTADIYYYCIGEANHDGDWGWINNVALANMLVSLDVKSYVSDKTIDHFEVGNKVFVYLHGKNNLTQSRPLPLVLNDKVENYLNEYLDENRILPSDQKVYIVKGDLHQSAITRGKRFTYHSVSSLYGSSNYILDNFGFTRWGCDYSILMSDGDKIDGIISDKY